MVELVLDVGKLKQLGANLAEVSFDAPFMLPLVSFELNSTPFFSLIVGVVISIEQLLTTADAESVISGSLMLRQMQVELLKFRVARIGFRSFSCWYRLDVVSVLLFVANVAEFVDVDSVVGSTFGCIDMELFTFSTFCCCCSSDVCCGCDCSATFVVGTSSSCTVSK